MDERISISFLILLLVMNTPFMNSMEDPRWTHGRWATGVNEHEDLLERSCQGEEYFQDLKERVKRRMLSKSCSNIPSELDDSDLNPLNKWQSMDIRRDFKKESFEDVLIWETGHPHWNQTHSRNQHSKVRRGMLRSMSCPNIPSVLDDSDFNPLNKWKSTNNGLAFKKEPFQDNDDGIRRSASSAQPSPKSQRVQSSGSPSFSAANISARYM